MRGIHTHRKENSEAEEEAPQYVIVSTFKIVYPIYPK
jgi:hypothetical protein